MVTPAELEVPHGYGTKTNLLSLNTETQALQRYNGLIFL